MTDAKTCQASPIDGTCELHPDDECGLQFRLGSSPVRHDCGDPECSGTVWDRPRALYDLPIFGWAWREDGRDLRA
jgi:hypothetical protein